MTHPSGNEIGETTSIVHNSSFVSFINSKFSSVKNFFNVVYNYLKTSFTISNVNIYPTLRAIATQFGLYLTAYLVFCYILYLIRVSFRNRLMESKYFVSSAKRILLIIAHPDEECRFFGPFILRMVEKNKCPYLLCLSNSGVDGKRQVRKRELWMSCEVLGIKPENVFLCCSSLREERGKWRTESVASLIRDYVEALGIDTVVTFGKFGIDRHENHITVLRAISSLNIRKLLPMKCSIFLLDSLGIMRKYSSMIDVIWSLYLSKDENIFILSSYEHEQVQDAMRMHKTQLHWHRRLYMKFSRYTYVNTFHELHRYTLPF
ncbi:N-acetylglucosaminyl-phosphatidylinositol de-N-acetylase-like [Macrosteles quadrilineatus]|uniref:N-acetylglucosaminyl-phosphatidylinositol de-N-acetylase-like n=1 Tax=Macrosteles quadrilineatus TaxID=74068 RepID=UPI0023E1C2B6|nr:N-acetylglucosaminyl-phosphatidylinositol de-N-acetylase-like [Macrosteles quadrilineatus]